MMAVPLTLTVSLCLVFTFVVFFIRERIGGAASNAERDSLMPLAVETPRTVEHHHEDEKCGCRDHSRPPCAGCLKHLQHR